MISFRPIARPAGNCKLQTLRQYYRLPEHGAGRCRHGADLFATVLRPIAEQRGLETWEQLAAYAAEEWFPSRIAFGKHKSRSIAEARTDAGLRRWLDGLAQSANARNARMGRWYLRSLEAAAEPSLFVAWECARDPAAVAVASRDLVLYVNPELPRLRALVDAARARLAELEAGFTIEKAKVEAMKARLFARLREHFQRRDRLRLVIGYRRKYLESLVRQGEEEAGKIAQEYRQASAHRDREYAETAAALAGKKWNHRSPVRFIAERWSAGSRGFQTPDYSQAGTRRGATFARHAPIGHSGQASLRDARHSSVRPGLESPGYRQASLRDGRRSISARSARSRNCAACGRASSWKSSACWRRAMRSRRAPITNCTG